MDDRDEIAELRREVEQQRALLNASYGTTITLIDMLTRALEDKGALDRVTLARALRYVVERDAKTIPQEPAEKQAQMILGLSMIAGYVENHLPPIPPEKPQTGPRLRVV